MKEYTLDYWWDEGWNGFILIVYDQNDKYITHRIWATQEEASEFCRGWFEEAKQDWRFSKCGAGRMFKTCEPFAIMSESEHQGAARCIQ